MSYCCKEDKKKITTKKQNYNNHINTRPRYSTVWLSYKPTSITIIVCKKNSVAALTIN